MFDLVNDSLDRRRAKRPARFSRTLLPALAVLFLVAILPTVVWSQVTDAESLRATIEEQFQVLPVQGGVLLTPRGEASVAAIEVRHGEVAIDGREVDRGALGARLGRARAAQVVELADLEPSELLELFGFASESESESDDQTAESVESEMREELAEAKRRVEESLQDAEDRRQELLEQAAEERDERREEIERELAEIEETHRAITEELRERTREIKRRDRERREALRHRGGDGESRVVVGSSVTVREGEEVAEVVAIGGSVTVDGDVAGDAVAIGGRARVDGTVSGGVVSVGSSVHLGEDAEVGGDVVSVGGKIHSAPGARVHGQTTEVNVLSGWVGPWLSGWDWEFDDHRPRSYFDGAVGDLIGTTVRAVLLGIAGLLLILFGRRRFERAAAYAGAEPLKAGLVGLVVLFMSVPLLVVLALVLAVSVIGIPLILLLPFLFLGLILLALFGYLAVAYQLGRWSQNRFGWRVLEPVAALVIGLVWLHGWSFMADLLDILDGPHDLAGFLVLLLALFGCLLKLGAWSVGLGSMLLTAGRGSTPVATGALPPVPPAPPTIEPPPGPGDGEGPVPEFDESMDVEGVVNAIWDEVAEEEAAETSAPEVDGLEAVKLESNPAPELEKPDAIEAEVPVDGAAEDSVDSEEDDSKPEGQ